MDLLPGEGLICPSAKVKLGPPAKQSFDDLDRDTGLGAALRSALVYCAVLLLVFLDAEWRFTGQLDAMAAALATAWRTPSSPPDRLGWHRCRALGISTTFPCRSMVPSRPMPRSLNRPCSRPGRAARQCLRSGQANPRPGVLAQGATKAD